MVLLVKLLDQLSVTDSAHIQLPEHRSLLGHAWGRGGNTGRSCWVGSSPATNNLKPLPGKSKGTIN